MSPVRGNWVPSGRVTDGLSAAVSGGGSVVAGSVGAASGPSGCAGSGALPSGDGAAGSSAGTGSPEAPGSTAPAGQSSTGAAAVLSSSRLPGGGLLPLLGGGHGGLLECRHALDRRQYNLGRGARNARVDASGIGVGSGRFVRLAGGRRNGFRRRRRRRSAATAARGSRLSCGRLLLRRRRRRIDAALRRAGAGIGLGDAHDCRRGGSVVGRGHQRGRHHRAGRHDRDRCGDLDGRRYRKDLCDPSRRGACHPGEAEADPDGVEVGHIPCDGCAESKRHDHETGRVARHRANRVPEPSARPKQERFDDGHGNAQRRGDLLVRQPQEVAQRQSFALTGGELRDLRGELCELLPLVGQLGEVGGVRELQLELAVECKRRLRAAA